ncbi:MAG: nitroreductase family protein [Candidatus Bathyarchaeia archaeon]
MLEAIKTRRSVRAFTNENVSEELLNKILDAARWAPSAGNLQPWEFVVVRDPKVKQGLAVAALHQMFIAEAPVVIVVCANENRSAWGYGKRGVALYCIQDTAAATQNILLTAHSLGLGACWVGAFDEEAAKRVLAIPAGVRPVAIIPLGYPAEKPSPPRRRGFDEILHYEKY